MEKTTLLIVEDEKKIADLIQDYTLSLFSNVEIIQNGLDALKRVKKQPPHFMILDIMLPGMDGLELLKAIRQKYNFPVLMVTAKNEEIDRVMGLEFGADDYLVKPFSLREMTARVKAIMKRVYPDDEHKKTEYKDQDLTLNTATRVVTCQGQELKLTPTEFSILLLFIQNPGLVLERHTIMQKVLGYEFEGYERTIDVHIKNIRKKIAKATEKEKIESIYGVGYKFLS